MTPKQFAEFLEYVKANNSWGEMGDCLTRNRVPYKYIEATWDSRDNTVFAIKLRTGGDAKGKVFRVDTPSEVESLYKYLNKPLRSGKNVYSKS